MPNDIPPVRQSDRLPRLTIASHLMPYFFESMKPTIDARLSQIHLSDKMIVKNMIRKKSLNLSGIKVLRQEEMGLSLYLVSPCKPSCR